MKLVRFVLGGVLLSLSFVAGAAEFERAVTFEPVHHHGAFIVRSVDGKTLCNDATPLEALRINARPRVATRVFGEESGRLRTHASAGLNIVLQGTAQLDANPAAKAAFERAAEIWESRIADQVTVYVKVDFGSTRFGEPFDENVIASANSHVLFSNDPSAFAEVRGLLAARGHNANETAVYGVLPASSLPTDIGATSGVSAASILFRAIGALDPVATPEENGPSIGFNSAFPYDFDPGNGISPGQTDFEGVVVHEIGHMLGFVSAVGYQELGSSLPPTIFDFFRFRPGVTLGTFGTAQRIQSSGGTHVYFTGSGTLGLSTGRADGTGGDENQASHWKDDAISGVRIGVMDPTLSQGVRTEVNDADMQAFGMMGYNIVSGSTPGGQLPAAPSSLTATGTSTTVIRLNWADNSNNETEFRIEQKIGSSFSDIGSAAANATQFNVPSLSAGQTATFRVRARNSVGDSSYSNEATGNTNSNPGSCTPNSTTVCLLNNRFRVKIDYVNPFSNPPNQPGTFLAARLLSGVQNPDTALFGFSSPQAVEVVVRLQDTRPFANRFDVYYGGMTDVGYTVTVTDTQTGTTRQYTNPVGRVGGGVDRNSFPTTALGMPDRVITSGGYDSFPAEPEVAPRPGLALAGIRATARPRAATRIVERVSSEFKQKSVSRVAANAGGAGACSEVEPNETTALADPLTLGQPCTGNANISHASHYEVGYDLDEDDIPDVWKGMQDVFSITTGAAGPLTVNLTFTNASADLDVFLFIDGEPPTIIGGGTSENTTETFVSSSLPAGTTYYVGVASYTGSSNYTLTVTGAASPSGCTPNSTTVCLLNNRFRVKIDYVNPFSNPPNQPGTFLAARLLQGVQNPDTALFGFSSAQAVEVVVRVQDTRPFAPRFDVYYGGMTDVGYTVTVTDTQTGTTRQYSNSVGTVGGGVDRTSFPAN